jgi:hypothetical protein
LPSATAMWAETAGETVGKLWGSLGLGGESTPAPTKPEQRSPAPNGPYWEHGEQRSSPSSFGASPAMRNGQPSGHRVVFEYRATQSDELDCLPGDEIVVSKRYPDGWAQGLNLETRQSGMFPLAVLDASAQ